MVGGELRRAVRWVLVGAALLSVAGGCRGARRPAPVSGPPPVSLSLPEAAPAPAVEKEDSVPEREAESGPSRELLAEVEWLRSTWPTETQEVRFEPLVPALLRWVPRGQEVRAHVYSHNHDCAPVILTRGEDEWESYVAENPDSRDDEPWPPELTGRVLESEQVQGGVPHRSYTSVHFGATFHEETGGGTEAQQPDGSWKEVSGYGAGDGGVPHGALVSVDEEVARFGGVSVVFEGKCDGPWEWLPCSTGGERPCNACRRIGILEYHPNVMGGGYPRMTPRYSHRRPTCSERCPGRSHPDMKRVRDLMAQVQFWRDGDEPVAERPSLYRSETRCRREHPVPGP